MFFPTDGRLGRSARQTAGIGASQFLDAGVEAIAAERNLDLHQLDLAGLDEIWDEVKANQDAP